MSYLVPWIGIRAGRTRSNMLLRPAHKLSIEYLPIESLVPNRANARTHSKRQISQIAASIERFGFMNPIFLGRGNVVRCGHGRLEAAKLRGLQTVPVIY